MAETRPSHPSINHMVLQVRDIEASQRFYTEVLGFTKCGQLRVPPDSAVDMRFYRGHPDGHHELALVQIPDPASAPDVPSWDMFTNTPGLAHVALAYGTREEWLAQLRHMQAVGQEVAVRGNHGMTHSALRRRPRRPRRRGALRAAGRGVGGRRRRGPQLLRAASHERTRVPRGRHRLRALQPRRVIDRLRRACVTRRVGPGCRRGRTRRAARRRTQRRSCRAAGTSESWRGCRPTSPGPPGRRRGRRGTLRRPSPARRRSPNTSGSPAAEPRSWRAQASP